MSNNTLPILSKKNHEKKTAKIKIMQFGEGNFLRAFIDWIIQKMNDSGKYEGHVVVVQPLPHGRVDQLEDQDGLYTLVLQGLDEKGEAVRKHRIIDVLDDFINPYTQYQKFLKYAESKDLEVIVSNTTEAGIAYDPNDVSVDFEKDCPASYPGKLLALLKHRYDTLGKSYGLAIAPCELIDDNGDKLKEVLIKLARDKNFFADFIDYLTNSCHYTSTLVDRIVPGFPKENFASLCEEYGYIDNNMDYGEYFHLFVLKKEPYVEEKYPVNKVGINAIYVDDVHPYKQRKVRILNGTHTSLVPTAYLAGFNEVGQSLSDPTINKFIMEEINKEIVPTVHTKDADKFASDVIKRFLNPYVHHQLMSIALNSLSKWKERDLPTILDDINNGFVPTHLCFAFASLIKFYDGYRIVNGKKEFIALKDDQSGIDFMRSAWDRYYADKNASELVNTVLSNTTLWSQDLTKVKGLANEVTKDLKLILDSPSQMAAIKEFLKHE